MYTSTSSGGRGDAPALRSGPGLAPAPPRRGGSCSIERGSARIDAERRRLALLDALLPAPALEEPTDPPARDVEVTRLLRAESDGGGDRAALLELVYEELRAIAGRRMRSERADHTLQATALVHEAWMRLERDQDMHWRDRRHFYGAAAEVMRRVLVDHARRAQAEKRGGGEAKVTLGAAELEVDFDAEHLLLLDDALGRLEREDERAAAVVRLRFLSGLSAEETAEELGVSERTVHREWTYARARLFELLGEA